MNPGFGETPDVPSPEAVRNCQACLNTSGNRVHRAREMMFGTRVEYEYLECASCGTLQLLGVPEGAHAYPAEYYTFGDPIRHPVIAWLKRERARAAFSGRGPIGTGLVRAFGYPVVVRWVKDWIKYAGVSTASSILDVGCGKAHIFPDLIALGFRSLTGIDPYLDRDIDFGGGVRARRMRIEDVRGPFDFVMCHHSFEHMPDPLHALRQIERVLGPGGAALIRIPLAASHAWRTYGVDWVQLDAPRHVVIPSRAGMRILADRAGLVVRAEVFDSDAFQFWGSEQYRQDLPLMDPRSHFIHPRRSRFTREQLREYTRQAESLNASGEGDAAGFYLTRPHERTAAGAA